MEELYHNIVLLSSQSYVKADLNRRIAAGGRWSPTHACIFFCWVVKFARAKEKCVSLKNKQKKNKWKNSLSTQNFVSRLTGWFRVENSLEQSKYRATNGNKRSPLRYVTNTVHSSTVTFFYFLKKKESDRVSKSFEWPLYFPLCSVKQKHTQKKNFKKSLKVFLSKLNTHRNKCFSVKWARASTI